MDNNLSNGKCAACREEKPLEIIRDSFLICASCNNQIEDSFKNNETTQCWVCKKQDSWLWGKFDTRQRYMCKQCSFLGLCHLCSKVYATTYLLHEGELPMPVCPSCETLNEKSN